MCSSTTTGISACYRLILCVSCLLFLLHQLLPSIFAFLVGSSPVIACTFLLLGILLILGGSNVPQIEKEDDDTVQATSKVHLRLKNRGVFKSKAHLGSSRRALRRLKEKTVVLGDRKADADGVTQVDSASVDSNSCLEDDEHGKNRSSNEKNAAVNEGKQSAAKLEDSLDSCSTPPTTTSSDMKSEEEGKPNSQVANSASVLNELDRLFESDYSSVGGVQDEEEEEDDEDEDEDDDDDETQEEKEDLSIAAVKFTTDDQRVLMELGKSELERNRRLEHILTWRRARQVREKNLLNEGNPEQSQGHLPFIYAPRRNPFDLPCDVDEPGSAPSMLRRNPIDLPHNQEASGDDNISSNLGDAVVLRRHESFTSGEKRPSRFKPYFGAEINKQFSGTGDSKPEQDSSESVDAEQGEKRNKDRSAQNYQDRELTFTSPSETGEGASEVDESANNAADEGRPNQRCQRLERSVIAKRDDRQRSEAPSTGFSWFAPPSLSSVDEIESGAKEISVIKEFDVIGEELRRVREDFGGPGFKLDSSTLSIGEQLLRPNLSSNKVKVEPEEES